MISVSIGDKITASIQGKDFIFYSEPLSIAPHFQGFTSVLQSIIYSCVKTLKPSFCNNCPSPG